MNQITSNFISALRSCILSEDVPAALHEPVFKGNEWTYVKECLDTGWVSSVGKFVDQFEDRLAQYVGAKRAVVVVNGTAALHISLLTSGINAGDEVLMPALTFAATANAVAYCGAIPHFVDVEHSTLGVDPDQLKRYLLEITTLSDGTLVNKFTGRVIKALVVMHAFGHPGRLDELLDVCRTFKIELIEDAAESLGSYYKGKHTGLWGRLSAFSFNGNKILTTGGGGAIITNDESLGRRLKHLTTTAKVPHPWQYYHDEVGYNYRMPNINAALGVAQLEQLPNFLVRKRALAEKYKSALANVEGITFVNEPKDCSSNFWLNAVLLNRQDSVLREDILKETNSAGFMTRPVWTLMHKLPHFSNCPRADLYNSEDIEARLINIPSGPKLGEHLV